MIKGYEMAGYIGRRILLAIFTVWVISMLSFFVIELPEGDLVSKAIDQKINEAKKQRN